MMPLANGFEVTKVAVLEPSANGAIAGMAFWTRTHAVLCAVQRNIEKLIVKFEAVVAANETNPRVRGEEMSTL